MLGLHLVAMPHDCGNKNRKHLCAASLNGMTISLVSAESVCAPPLQPRPRRLLRCGFSVCFLRSLFCNVLLSVTPPASRDCHATCHAVHDTTSSTTDKRVHGSRLKPKQNLIQTTACMTHAARLACTAHGVSSCRRGIDCRNTWQMCYGGVRGDTDGKRSASESANTRTPQ